MPSYKGYQERGSRGGGGTVGQLAPTTWKLWESRPPTLDCQCRSFLFLFVFARELGSLPPKIVGQIRGVFRFGFWVGVILDPGRRFPPPPPTSKYLVPTPLEVTPNI